MASPTPTAGTAGLSVPSDLDPEKGGAEAARRERLRMENQHLKQANTALDEARQKAEAESKRTDETTRAVAALTAKMLGPNLKVPQTPSEAGSLAGKNVADTTKFKQKWGDSVPAAGTPEADEYAREQDVLVGESAALFKFLHDEQTAAFMKQRDGIAQYQEASLAGALTLRADQVQGINTALDGYYQQLFTRGLNSAARPQTGSVGGKRNAARSTSNPTQPFWVS